MGRGGGGGSVIDVIGKCKTCIKQINFYSLFKAKWRNWSFKAGAAFALTVLILMKSLIQYFRVTLSEILLWPANVFSTLCWQARPQLWLTAQTSIQRHHHKPWHCVKSLRIQGYSGPPFSRIWTKYGEIQSIRSECGKMRKNCGSE